MQRAVVLRVGVTFEQIENEHLQNLLVFRVWIIWGGTKEIGGHCPPWLRASTRCIVFQLTCSIQCLGRLERHNTSIFLVLIFVPAWSHAAENRSNACWRLCWEEPCMQYQFIRKKQRVHPAVSNSGTLVDASVTAYPSVVQLLTFGPLHKTW